MPYLRANRRFRIVPDELRANITELSKIEWLVVVHGILPRCHSSLHDLEYRKSSCLPALATLRFSFYLSRLRKRSQPGISMLPKHILPLVQSSFADVHQMNAMLPKARAMAVITYG